MLRKKNRKQRKRTTFIRLFARNAVIGLLLTAIFAGAFFIGGREYLFSQAEQELYFRTSRLQATISSAENTETLTKESLISSLRFSSGYATEHNLISTMTENSAALAVITDEEGNILYSSQNGLQALIRFSDEEKKIMLCDTESLAVPELTQLKEDFHAMAKKQTENVYTNFHLLSAYVNDKNNQFIPHEAIIRLVQYHPRNETENKIIESKQYSITIPDEEDYRLISVNQSVDYPSIGLSGFFGTDNVHFDELINDERMQNIIRSGTDSENGFYNESSTTNIYYMKSAIWLSGEKHALFVAFRADIGNSAVKSVYFRTITIFMIIMLIIAFLDSWRKNVRNQAEYAFADYQKALTDNLAHDLKTPLMAIGGYAENLIENQLSETEKTKYLQSILDNVSYTDSIISRTLELNSIYPLNSLKKEKVDIFSLIEQTSEKYTLLLEEKNIPLTVSGQAEITADMRLLETVIENLLSNAVKYTAENGTIQISINSKSCCISNTVRKKIDVSELKQPFKKGDTARSGKSGSGLGLSLADKAAEANHFQLILSCSNTEYTAELKF